MSLEWLGKDHPRLPLILTIPHSGETIPPEADWLAGISDELRLYDIDRFVDQLYSDAARTLPVSALVTRVHRYAADLNRYPDDVDQSSVAGSKHPPGTFPSGFHWVKSTDDQLLIRQPIPAATHARIVERYHDAFHAEFATKLQDLRTRFTRQPIFHLDCHSMPSQGTAAHVDSGKRRPEVVISDFEGRSSSAAFKDLVISTLR